MKELKPLIQISKLAKSFPTSAGNVIDKVDLEIKQATIVALLGESGSGKTTLARLVAGLEVPDSGTIKINGELVAGDRIFVPPQNRPVGMLFQDYALFPHMTVWENITYGIQNLKNTTEVTNQVLELVGLSQFGKRYPHQLSGGQQQRVALARALAPKPQLLILDEPFSNLDASLKLDLRTELFHIIRSIQLTAIFLTHDTPDAMAVSDDIVILKEGRLAQQGDAVSLYEKPKNEYVASLFSPLVHFDFTDLGFFKFEPVAGKPYALRQDAFKINSSKASFVFESDVDQSIFLGSHFLNTVSLPNNKILHFTSHQKLDKKIVLGFDESSLLVFES